MVHLLVKKYNFVAFKLVIMSQCKILILLAAIIMQGLYVGAAQDKKVYITTRAASDVPVIDGFLDDDCWQNIEWEKGFIQQEPYEGKAPSQETGFKILYDNDNIYIAFRAFDTNPDSIDRRLSRKDESDGDLVAIQLDSYYDQRTAFTFMVNAAGVKTDGIFSNDGQNEDYTWDPIWWVKTSIDQEGWAAEMRIPLSQLRFDTDDQVWGLQVGRLLFRKQELSLWQFIPRDAPGWVHLFGELQGIIGIKPKRQVEIAPYVVAGTERFKKEEGNPFATGKLNRFNAGVDGKVGLTNNMIIDFTLNPDFGQVEADPSQVNLTAYEIFFEEKRPFFIEGKNILNSSLNFFDGGDLGGENLFYSRRIGRDPQYYPELQDNEYADMPTSTSILGAAKLTGKTKNGLSIGVLESVTAREKAEIDRGGERKFETVEPLTNYSITRIQKDFNKGNTIFGGVFTTTNRQSGDSTLDFLHSSAYTGGLDFTHHWKERTYSLMVKTYFSYVQGSEEALLRTQESSARYYQRPDNNYTKLDSGRTSLAGHGGTIALGKFANGHWSYAGFIFWKSPGFEINDIGFMSNADWIMQVLWAQYRIWEPFSIFREMRINLNQWTIYDFGGNLNIKGGNISFETQFKNYWQINASINPQLNARSNTTLRGGPAFIIPANINTNFAIESDERKKFTIELFASQSWGAENCYRSQDYGTHLSYRPVDALDIWLIPSINMTDRTLQYITTKDLDADEKRYIFGSLQQKTMEMSLRLNLSITPNFTLQYWGQPFISVGEYSEFKKITLPQAEQYNDRYQIYSGNEIAWDDVHAVYQVTEGPGLNYSFENPDFKVKEFKSNFVARWEYVPGSTIYLVWSQGRSRSVTDGEFDISKDMEDMFDIYPHDIFLVKLSYRFGL
jgi:hypothetical protein